MKKTMTEIMKTERQMLTLVGVAAKAFAQDTLAGKKAYQMARGKASKLAGSIYDACYESVMEEWDRQVKRFYGRLLSEGR